MKYDSIILELLARIQALEETVDALSGVKEAAAGVPPIPAPTAELVVAGLEERPKGEPAKAAEKPVVKVCTADVRNYIMAQKREAAARGERELVFKASTIHRTLKMKNRIPLVASAMRQCMAEGDEVLHDTPSGKSSTLEIRYWLPAADEDGEAEE